MLHPIVFLCPFGVVPMVHGTDQIACDAADSFKRFVSVALMPSAAGALVVDNAGIAAAGISVYRMVDRAVSNTRFFHAADNLFESIQVL